MASEYPPLEAGAASDPYQHVASLDVTASPEALYDLVTDIARTGEWSPICRACWWKDDDSPRVGGWFFGRNEADGRAWETESQVAVATPGQEFAWIVGGQYARWGFQFMQCDPQTTTVTESWHLLPAGREMFAARYGVHAEERIGLRALQAREGIPATLAAIKRIAESQKR
jgi:hypothetical protein